MEEFNTLTDSTEYELWLLGQEVGDDGSLVQVDTPYAVCGANGNIS